MDARKQRRLLRRVKLAAIAAATVYTSIGIRTLRKAKRFIYREWIWITLGIILTRFAVEYAYQERGYMAYGGEWLVLPVLLLTVNMARNIAGTVMMIVGGEEDADARRIEADHRRVRQNRRRSDGRRSR